MCHNSICKNMMSTLCMMGKVTIVSLLIHNVFAFKKNVASVVTLLIPNVFALKKK